MPKEIVLTKENYHMLGCDEDCEELVIPHKFPYQGKDYVITAIGAEVFENWKKLKRVVIKDGIKEIRHDAFRNCISLVEIIISNSVTYIGNSAFYGCTSLTDVTMPNSVTHIDSRAFKECTSLTSVHISEGVVYIGFYVFDGCTSLRELIVPDNVNIIEFNAFRGIPVVKYNGKLQGAPWGALSVIRDDEASDDWQNVKKVVLPEGINEADTKQGAFSGWSSVQDNEENKTKRMNLF